MASKTQNLQSGKRLTLTLSLLLCATAATIPSHGEAAVLRLPTLCDLTLEELLTIGILPGDATDRAPTTAWPHSPPPRLLREVR